MKEITKDEALALVESFVAKKEIWHYHLLTPTCQFNTSSRFAIFIENLDTEQTFVLYSDLAEMELSNTLSGMLHGKEVLEQKNTASNYRPSIEVIAMLELIDKLDTANTKWHHHVFFPGCTFNTHPDMHELVIEDPRNNTYLMSITNDEPKEDLKQIEYRFYRQKKLN